MSERARTYPPHAANAITSHCLRPPLVSTLGGGTQHMVAIGNWTTASHGDVNCCKFGL